MFVARFVTLLNAFEPWACVCVLACVYCVCTTATWSVNATGVHVRADGSIQALSVS